MNNNPLYAGLKNISSMHGTSGMVATYVPIDFSGVRPWDNP